MDLLEMIRSLRADQDREITEMGALVSSAQAREESLRDFTEDENARFEALTGSTSTRSTRITELVDQATRAAAEAEAVRALNIGTAHVTSEPGPYTPDSSRSGGNSFFRDLWRAGKGDQNAVRRLHDNTAHRNAFKDRAITTVFGAGGEFVPPLWLEQQFVPLARAGRAAADLCTKDALPEGTNSINLPVVSTGTAVAAQVTQNTAIQQTDITTTSIQSGVFTVAGGQTMSLQLIEQSPLNVDKIVLMDLAKAYGIQIDAYVLNGSGTNQPLGLFNVASTNSVTFTSTTPTLGGSGVNALYPKMANLVQLVQTSRFDVPTYWLMHPRRWYWILAQSDSSNRPMVVPANPSQNPQNNPAAGGGTNVVQGEVGSIMGIPVVVDPNVPITLGGGTEDGILLCKWDDLWLWESHVRAEAFEQTFANQLSLFVRLYNYMSFQGARYPKAIGKINGTAFATANTTF